MALDKLPPSTLNMESSLMILPLQDRNNPLYGLMKREQCLKLINWQNQGLKPWEIFSLYEDYTEDDIKQAYHHLALHFHPDRNPDISQTQAAFNLIKEASDYLHYGLKSASEKSLEFNAIRNNSFYAVYGESGFTQSKLGSAFGEFQSAIYFDEFGNPHLRPTTTTVPKKKAFNEMSFEELVIEAQHSPIPEAVINELKRFVLKDKSWLTFSIDKERPQRNLLHVIASYGDVDFFIWLIEQGADPFFTVRHMYRRSFDFDAGDCAVRSGNLEMIQYLLRRYGTAPFYDQTSDDFGLSPQWRRLKDAIRFNETSTARFLLNEVGYAKYLGNQQFWGFSSLLDRGDKSATVALMLEYGLWDDLEIEKSLCEAVEEGELAIAQQILDKKPEVSIKKIFKAYTGSRNRASKASLDWMLGLLDSRPIEADDLSEMLEDLGRLLYRHCDTTSRHMAWALIPKLFSLVHASEVLPGDRRGPLSFAYITVAKSAGYETLAKLLDITSEPLNDSLILFWAVSATKKGLDGAMKRTISLLINAGGSQLETPNGNSNFPMDEDPDNKYFRYTPLHLLCEMGFQEQALHLIAKMREEGFSFDAVALKKERQPGRQLTQYYYTSLHLAIAKGNEELAINLIEAGASIAIKAVIERPPTYFASFFSDVDRVEKTPLEMAIELHQTEVIRKIQLMMLDDYITTRKNEEEYLSQVRVCGHTLFRFGYYSKTKKLEEAWALKEILLRGELNDEDLNRINHGPLSQGRLGQIAQLSHYLKNSTERPVLEGFKV